MNEHAALIWLVLVSAYLVLDSVRAIVKMKRRKRWGPSRDELDAAIGIVQHFIRATNRESPDDRILAIKISGIGASTDWENNNAISPQTT